MFGSVDAVVGKYQTGESGAEVGFFGKLLSGRRRRDVYLANEMTDDTSLLRDYAANRSEEAFAELVRRNFPLVYSAAARRPGGDAHGAADVAQGVFTALARDADRLSRRVALTTVLASESVVAMPSNLATAVAGAALAGGSASAAGAVTFMTTTKILAAIGAAVLIGGTVGLVSQQRTIAELRDRDARAQQQLAVLAAESAENLKARSEEQNELTRLQLELAASKGAGRVEARAVETSVAGGLATAAPAVDSAAREKKKAEMRRRYGPFFQQCGLTAEQTERMVELRMQQADAREDLQGAVEAAGLRGDTKGIEAMRSKLYEPITKAVREILGEGGYKAYLEYETTSFYRGLFVEPLGDLLAVANAPLSSEQTEKLVRALDARKQLQKAKPTDIGSAISIDWDAVIGDMSGTLTPAQVNVIRVYAEREKAKKL